MIQTYNQAITRLKARRNDNSDYANAAKQIYQMSNDLNREQQSINSRIGNIGNSLSAQVGAMLSSQKSISDIYNEVYQNATVNQSNRNNQIDNKIEELTFARDAEEEAKAKAKKASSQALWKTGITTASTLIASLIPGGGVIAPMIGNAVGNLVAGSGIIDQTGDADPQMLMNAASDVFSATSSIQSTMANKKAFADASKFMGGNMKSFAADGSTPANFLALNPIQQETFKSALATGNYDQMYELMGQQRPKMRMGDYLDTSYWRQ